MWRAACGMVAGAEAAWGAGGPGCNATGKETTLGRGRRLGASCFMMRFDTGLTGGGGSKRTLIAGRLAGSFGATANWAQARMAGRARLWASSDARKQ